MNRKILVIDDEVSIQSSLKASLEDEGYQVTTLGSGEEGIAYLREHQPDLILLDIWMEGMDGLSTLKKVKETWPEQIVLMMSGHGTIETAVKATKLGALDFIEKPLSLEKLLVSVQNALQTRDLRSENRALKKQAKKQDTLVGESEPLQKIKELIEQVAPTTGSVLITGENGTGKELVAQSIHRHSMRANGPFIEVNCAAIPEELIESELFGHEKGAFTGATEKRRGKFDLADKGTLFLDEIGDMSLKTQAKILRILQEQRFERVGGTQTIEVDVRIVAATNKGLKQEMGEGRFREDLYYRLNVIPFHIPPLRERADDIPLLAGHFMKNSCENHQKAYRAFTPDALRALHSYSWPGNVRELRNLIERLVILTTPKNDGENVEAATILDQFEEPISESHPAHLTDRILKQGNTKLKEARQEFEKDFIFKSLQETDWNVSKTAERLGIERSHLHRKIKLLGLEEPK